MLLIALTFLPALLSILGRAVFWPSKTSKRELKIGLWGRLADKSSNGRSPCWCWASSSSAACHWVSSAIRRPASATKRAERQRFGRRPASIDGHFPAANNNPATVDFAASTSRSGIIWQLSRKLRPELTGIGAFKAVSGPFNANGFALHADYSCNSCMPALGHPGFAGHLSSSSALTARPSNSTLSSRPGRPAAGGHRCHAGRAARTAEGRQQCRRQPKRRLRHRFGRLRRQPVPPITT